MARPQRRGIVMTHLVLLLLLIGGLCVPQDRAQAAAPQIRGFWVDAFHEGFKTPEQTRQLIADARRAGANALFVQARRRADSYYRNSTEPVAADVAPGYDPLADIIAQAHAAGLQVHGWAVTFPAWKSGYDQPDRSHVWYQHGPDRSGADNWFTLNAAGKAGDCGAPSDCGYALDPGHPDAANYVVNTLLHLATRYDLDGLHLDYIRYPSIQFGYNPVALDRFRRASGRTDTPAPDDQQWMQWRRDQVTKLVKRVYLNLHLVKPRMVLSVAAIAWGAAPPNGDWRQSSPYLRTLQDWNGWLDAGYVDLAIPMVYDRDDGGQGTAWYNGWVDYARTHQGRRATAIGVGAWLNNPDSNIAQIQRGASGTQGTLLYSYAIPATGDRNAFLDRLRSAAWADSAPFPQFGWKQQAATGHALGKVLVNGGGADAISVKLSGNNQPDTYTTTDSNGVFGYVDLQPGSYTATIRDPLGSGDARWTLAVQPGAVATLEARFPLGDAAAEWTPTSADSAFAALWKRTDQPVAQGQTARSWMWGPAAWATGTERYAEAPGGKRLVQYWDKSRMEITDPGADRSQLWFVTNGLLTRELISGQAQIGNGAYAPRSAAMIPVAGDPDDTSGPTYASFANIASLNADRRSDSAIGATIGATINRDGTRGFNQDLLRYGVKNDSYNRELGHNIPDVFNAYFRTLPLDWVFVLGYPIADAYWARVKVGGQVRDVLVQPYERRVLTYTPANAAQYRVEMGNVGQHYWRWRYGSAPWQQ